MQAPVSNKKRDDTEMSLFSEFPDDLLVEIISRVPFKSTRCCKCVCRRWRDVVSHPDHRNKLPRSTLAGFFYKTGNLHRRAMNRHYKGLAGNWCPRIDPSLSFLPKNRPCDIHIDMLDCCNGLLLCRRQRADCYRTTDYVGQLYLAISSASELLIWTLEDSSSENWTLKHNVSNLQLFGAKDSSYARNYSVIIHPEYKVIVLPSVFPPVYRLSAP
ncbi:hypothetical protein QYE76_057688 [Lolium multiflorum]|uniref:F-box domain-containing protein n=1 Tax=Lolium multiflorum TaxID=4521 RepID=A0AAD8T4P0_LOLMU|nr:hypothetical protein QYE76_057688 [Lolium multiflorum]